MVRPYSRSNPIFFGFNYGRYISDGVMDKSTQVLSKGGLQQFIEVGLHEKSCNRGFDDDEEVGMMRCLNASNIRIEDSRDHLGRERYLKLQNELQTYKTGFITVSCPLANIESII